MSDYPPDSYCVRCCGTGYEVAYHGMMLDNGIPCPIAGAQAIHALRNQHHL